MDLSYFALRFTISLFLPVLISLTVLLRESRRRGYNPTQIVDIFFLSLIVSFFSTHFISNFFSGSFNEVINPLAYLKFPPLEGGLLFTLVTLYFVGNRRGLSIWELMDIFLPSLLVIRLSYLLSCFLVSCRLEYQMKFYIDLILISIIVLLHFSKKLPVIASAVYSLLTLFILSVLTLYLETIFPSHDELTFLYALCLSFLSVLELGRRQFERRKLLSDDSDKVIINMKGMKTMSKVSKSRQFLDRMKSQLTSEEKKLQSEISRLEKEKSELKNSDTLTGNSEFLDEANEQMTADLKNQEISFLTNFLMKVKRALDRIQNGTYGKSVKSGVEIPDSRLKANPAAETTLEEQMEEDKKESSTLPKGSQRIG